MTKVVCFYLPAEIQPPVAEIHNMVIIDTFRMTSVAITALANGCAGMHCLVKIDDALQFKRKYPSTLLGGEREGKQIAGFDFGNSPLEYTPKKVAGKYIALTTTNGTRAIDAAKGAPRMLLGAFLNARAVAEALTGSESLGLLCAGTKGRLTLEDVLTAGAILDRLRQLGTQLDMDDAAQLALRAYLDVKGDLDATLRCTRHYRNLAALGPAFQADLAYCLREDVLETVPELRDGWFVASEE